LKTNDKACTSWTVGMWTHGVITHESYTLVAKKFFNVKLVFNSPNLVAPYNYNATPQKTKRNLLHA